MSDKPGAATVPLMLLAQSWAISPEELTSQLDPDAIIVDCLRVKHVRVDDACALLEKRDLEAARHRAETEARNAEMARACAAQAARIQAIQQKATLVRQADPNLNAYGVMVSGDRDERLEAASERLDELQGIGPNDFGTMHRYVPKENP